MFFNRKSIKVITPFSDNSEKVISLADMKSYLRVDTTSEDALINDLIDVATDMIKQYTRRAIITETLELILDRPSNSGADELDRLGDGVHNTTRQSAQGWTNEVDLPFIPIQSITSIKTYDTTNAESAMTSTDYELDGDGGRIYLDTGISWPSSLRDREAMKIRYVAGYGSSPQDIPPAIRQALRMLVAHMYECRTSCDMPADCKKLLEPFKLYDTLGFC